MYRSILVPIDGSPLSEYALPIASDIARRSGATLHLVHVHMHVTPAPIYVEGLPVIDEHLQSLGKVHEHAYLEGIRDQLATELDLPITVAVLDSLDANVRDRTIPDMLASYAVTANTDLIVMTTHGRGGLARFWLGSVADALIRVSPVPVLLLRPGEHLPSVEHPRAFRQILIALDGSALSEEILEHALGLGALVQAEYTLLCVVEPFTLPGYNPIAQTHGLAAQATEEARAAAQTYLDSVAQRLQAAGATVHTRVLIAEQVAAAILEDASQHSIDVIAMSTHGRSGLVRLLIGSVADKVLRGAERAVLVYRPPEPDDRT
jgi:nucleotide-binding universal stress UspA family protein